LELRAEAREAQPSCVTRQPDKLHTHTHKLLYLFWLRAVHTKVTTFIKRIHSIWRTSREEDKENRKRKWGDDIITDIRTSLTWM
jgi:hypothetical protein